jgi:hypothetical protein
MERDKGDWFIIPFTANLASLNSMATDKTKFTTRIPFHINVRIIY